jgi:hypothetical protein
MYHVTFNYAHDVTYGVTAILMSPHVSLGNKSVMIYLPTSLVHESRRYGLNISGISRKALRDTISRLEGSSCSCTQHISKLLVRPPGFEPGFLPYGDRSEAVRLMLAGLRRADARVPVLDQARLRPLAATEAYLIAKALRFRHFPAGLVRDVPASCPR